MRTRLVTCLLLSVTVTTVTLDAQRDREATPFKLSSVEARKWADRISTVEVGVEGGWYAYEMRHRKWEGTCEILSTVGTVEVLKRTIKRERPDGSDHFSTPSEHTALATVMSPKGWGVLVPVTVAIGRAASWKHYISDTAFGAGIGLFYRWACR